MYCDICSKEVGEKNCIYHCAECTYFAHIQCAISISPADTKSHQDPAGADDHPQLPTQISYLFMPDESSSNDLANSLIEKVSFLGASEVGRGLKEGRCDHNSTLLDAQTNEICDACVRPISTPYYNCSECHLVLHKSCAELPSEIQHPFHTIHRLILQKTSLFKCDACGRYCNGFSYGCHTGRCNFDLDINCAYLPTTIRHEAHEHPLNLVDDKCDEWCSCCHSDCSDLYKFRCRDCKFHLHIQCASLPKTLRHRYDRHHALILKYTPVGIKLEEYYCEICEEEMNTKLWFYYCADCNYAFHTKCLYTAADESANVKLGTIIHMRNHPHPLTLARKANYKPVCDMCHGPIVNSAIGTSVFQCKVCDFTVDFLCGRYSAIV